jgi:hypothetical protein
MTDTDRFPGRTDSFAPVIPKSLRNLTPAYWGKVDWEAIATQEIESDILEVLDFDLSLEGHVSELALYLHSNRILRREDLVSPHVAAWQVEEAFHEIAIHNTLAHHVKDMPERSTFRRRDLSQRDRFGVLRPIGAVTAGVFAPRTSKELIIYNGVKGEAVAQGVYEMAADLTENEALNYLLGEIAFQEAGHGHMFQSWSEDSPASQSSQWLVRKIAQHTPKVLVGEGYQQPERVARVIRILSAHPDFEQKILRVDGRIDKLPGLEGMHVVERHTQQIIQS